MGKIVYTPGVVVGLLPDQKGFWKGWEKKIRTASKRLAQETSLEHDPVEVDFSIFTPDKYLLSEATIVGGVESEPGHPGWICEPHGKFLNDNGNFWFNQVLIETYKSFIWAENYLEHVQEPALSKGKILDAVLWVVREFEPGYREPIPTVFVDILVATNRKHAKLVASIESGDMRGLSMGTEITHSQCSKCCRIFREGEDEPCRHIKNDLGKYFHGDDGKRHRIGEGCGVPGIKNSNKYIEACVRGDTRVVTPDGCEKVSNLVGRSPRILTEYGVRQSETVKNTRRDRVCRIRTKLGNNLYATKDHQVKVLGEEGIPVWRTVSEIHEGDYLLCRRGDGGVLPENRGQSEDFWFAAGVFYGGGSYQNKGDQFSFAVRKGEEEILSRIETWLVSQGYEKYSEKEFGGSRSAERRTKELYCIYKQLGRSDEIRRSKVPVYRISASHEGLKKVIPSYQSYGNWRNSGVPEVLWDEGRRQIGAFLRGLFSADACAFNTSTHVGLTTKRRKLAQDVQKLLLLLGCVSAIRRKSWVGPFGGGRAYVVELVGKKSRVNFANYIGFEQPAKQRRIGQMLVTKRETQRQGYYNATPLLNSIFQDPIREQSSIATTVWGIKRGKSNKVAGGSIDRIIGLAEKYGTPGIALETLKSYRDEDWFFDRVTKITEEDSIVEVFDPVNVNGTSSYVSNGVVSHNSWVKVQAFEPAVRHDTLRVGDVWSGKILKAKVPQSRIQESARET